MIRCEFGRMLAWSAVALAALVAGQILGVMPLTFAGLTMAVLGLLKTPDSLTLSAMLFWLPWASVMKFSADSFSVLTLGAVLLLIKLSVARSRFLETFPVLAGLALVTWVVGVRLWRGEVPDLSFVSSAALLLFIPSYARYLRGRVSIALAGVALGFGVVSASVVSTAVSETSRLAQFVVVGEELRGEVVRLSGFVGDPNFYSAQVLVAIGLILSGWLRGDPGVGWIQWILAVALVYFGATSISKSFLITLAVVASFVLVYVPLRMGRRGVAFVLTLGLIMFGLLSTSQLFVGVSEMYASRLLRVSDFDSLTTSRGTIQQQYIDYLGGDDAVLFFGQGMAAEYPFGYASHNTAVQAIYLFGILGSVLLLVWVASFGWRPMANPLDAIPVIICVVLPWMGLDAILLLDFHLFVVCAAMACAPTRAPGPLSPRPVP